MGKAIKRDARGSPVEPLGRWKFSDAEWAVVGPLRKTGQSQGENAKYALSYRAFMEEWFYCVRHGVPKTNRCNQFLSKYRHRFREWHLCDKLEKAGTDSVLVDLLRTALMAGRGQVEVYGNLWGKVVRDPNADVAGNRSYYARRLELAHKTLGWCERKLKVGDGVGFVGRPWRWMDWFREFIEESYSAGIHEAGLSIARKNGKTASLAAWEIGCLVGPLRQRGYECLVASEDERKAGQFLKYMKNTCVESGLMSRDDKKRGVWQDDVGVRDGENIYQVLVAKNEKGQVLRGVSRHIDSRGGDSELVWGEVRVLPFGEHIGDALRATKVVIDEGGRLGEPGKTSARKHRTAWNTLLSAMGSGGDMFVVVSAQYRGEMFRTMREEHARGENDQLFFMNFESPEDCALDDEAAWALSNPALAYGVKDRNHMRRLCRKAMVNESDEHDFRQQDLNQPQASVSVPLISEGVMRSCVAKEVGGDVRAWRRGGCFLGMDIGNNMSMSVVCVGWYGTGFVEAYGAFPGKVKNKATGRDEMFGLLERSHRDGEGDLYGRLGEAGEITLYSDHYVVPYGQFLMDVWGRICRDCDRREQTILHVAMDPHRQMDYYESTQEWLREAGQHGLPALNQQSQRSLRFPSFRKGSDKHTDITATQKGLMSGRFQFFMGYGGGLMVFSVKNGQMKDSNGLWNFVRTADGKNDAVVALSCLGGQFSREDQLRKNKKSGANLVFL